MMGLMVDGGILKQCFPYNQVVDPSFAQKAISHPLRRDDRAEGLESHHVRRQHS
jgi:hypothetical protein